jgi:hypothetical protein
VYELPCGKTTFMSPLLQCVINGTPTKAWRCSECHERLGAPAPGGVAQGARVLRLFPVVLARGRQGGQVRARHEGHSTRKTALLDVTDAMELILDFEPDMGAWVAEPEYPPRPLRPGMVQSSARPLRPGMVLGLGLGPDPWGSPLGLGLGPAPGPGSKVVTPRGIKRFIYQGMASQAVWRMARSYNLVTGAEEEEHG